jgi:hypothetical protein
VFVEGDLGPRFKKTKTVIAAGAASLLFACASPKPIPEKTIPDWVRPGANILQIDTQGETVDQQRNDFTNQLYDIAQGPCKIRAILSLAVHNKPKRFHIITEEKHCNSKFDDSRKIPELLTPQSKIKQIDSQGTLFIFSSSDTTAAKILIDKCGQFNADQTIPQIETRLATIEKPCKI